MREKPYTAFELLEALHKDVKEKGEYPDTFEYVSKQENVTIDDTCFLTSKVSHGPAEGLFLDLWVNIERDEGKPEQHLVAVYKCNYDDDGSYYELERFAVSLDMSLHQMQNRCPDDFVWKGYKMQFLKGNKDLVMLADSKEQIVSRYNARREFFAEKCTGCKVINFATKKEQIISEENIKGGLLDISQLAV